MSKFQTTARALAPAIAIAAALTCSGGANAALTDPVPFEGFENFLPNGWTADNNSSPVGITNWFQGSDFYEAAPGAGSDSSFASANYLNTIGLGTISNWLIAPELTFNNGDVVTFLTRTVDVVNFPDRLELRFSNVGGTDVGTSPTDVGTFTKLLLTVNPNLTKVGYPTDWTSFSAPISGLSGPTKGAIAFRYFVTAAGTDSELSINSEQISIDSVSITAVPEPAAYLLMALGLGVIGLRRMRATRG